MNDNSPITLEQRLASHQMRLLWRQAAEHGESPELERQGLEIMQRVTGLPEQQIVDAFLAFNRGPEPKPWDSKAVRAKKAAVPEVVAEMFLTGQLDLVGIRDNQLVWTASDSFSAT